MGGVFIAASIGSTGEVHYDPFGGALTVFEHLGATVGLLRSGDHRNGGRGI